jgi:hypothetical protein
LKEGIFFKAHAKPLGRKKIAFVTCNNEDSGQAWKRQPRRLQMEKQLREMVELNDAELDAVAAGALINAVLVDVVDVQDVNVAVPVNAAVAAGILGTAGAAAFQQPGRQR